jgi:hypothetical protein
MSPRRCSCRAALAGFGPVLRRFARIDTGGWIPTIRPRSGARFTSRSWSERCKWAGWVRPPAHARPSRSGDAGGGDVATGRHCAAGVLCAEAAGHGGESGSGANLRVKGCLCCFVGGRTFAREVYNRITGLFLLVFSIITTESRVYAKPCRSGNLGNGAAGKCAERRPDD